jgi:hypothetical protein
VKLSELQRVELSQSGLLQSVAYSAFLDSDIRIIQRSGGNTDVDTATAPEDLWGGSGPYLGFPSTAETVRVVSSSANDTSAGSGARTIRISGLDATGAFQTETVTLNGTTPVTTTNTYLRVNRAFVVTSGSSNTAFNAGDITISQGVTTTNIFAIIDTGYGAARCAVYTVPLNTTGVLKRLAISGLRSNTAFNGVAGLCVKDSGAAPRMELVSGFSSTQSYIINQEGGLYLPPLADLVLRVISVSANNISMDGNFELVLLRSA